MPFLPGDSGPFLATLKSTLDTLRFLQHIDRDDEEEKEKLQRLSVTSANRRQFLTPNSVHYTPPGRGERKRLKKNVAKFEVEASMIGGEDAAQQLENANRNTLTQHQKLKRKVSVNATEEVRSERKRTENNAAVDRETLLHNTPKVSSPSRMRVIKENCTGGSYEKVTTIVVSDDDDHSYDFDGDRDVRPMPPILPVGTKKSPLSLIELMDLIDQLAASANGYPRGEAVLHEEVPSLVNRPLETSAEEAADDDHFESEVMSQPPCSEVSNLVTNIRKSRRHQLATFRSDTTSLNLEQFGCEHLVEERATRMLDKSASSLGHVYVNNIKYTAAIQYIGRKCCFFDPILECLLRGTIVDVCTLRNLKCSIAERPPTFFQVDLTSALGLGATAIRPELLPFDVSLVPASRWVPYDEVFEIPTDTRNVQQQVLRFVRKLRAAYPNLVFTDLRCSEWVAAYGGPHLGDKRQRYDSDVAD